MELVGFFSHPKTLVFGSPFLRRALAWGRHAGIDGSRWVPTASKFELKLAREFCLEKARSRAYVLHILIFAL